MASNTTYSNANYQIYNNKICKINIKGGRYIIVDLTTGYFHLPTILKYLNITVKKWTEDNKAVIDRYTVLNKGKQSTYILYDCPVQYRGTYIRPMLVPLALKHITPSAYADMIVLTSISYDLCAKHNTT